MSAPADLRAVIESGSATICRAWIVTRRDGQRFGFTDHDAPVSVDGVECRPDSGALGSAIQRRLGLEVDRSDIRGALDDSRITDADLEAGRWRGAEIALWLVDWSGGATPWRFDLAVIGETRRRGAAWVWELSDVLAQANQAEGAVIQRKCAWFLGDVNCGVNIDDPAYKGAFSILSVQTPRKAAVSGLDGFASGWFTRGVISWTVGANAGSTSDVARHQTGALTLLDPPMFEMQPGDEGAITAGCDHSPATCRAKFSNGARFGGDPFSITESEFFLNPTEDQDLGFGPIIRR